MTKSEDKPLVSVVVITYNSAKTVIETLDSIKAQTYQNIELIVSDDYSKDNTFEICRNWLEKEKGRFRKSQLLGSNTNTGTCANLNRGIVASCGTWIKSLAGDDILIPNCIKTFVDFVHNCEYEFVICNLMLFSNTLVVPQAMVDSYSSYFIKAKESFASKKKRIIHENVFPGPAYFYTRHLYDKVGGYDENYKLMEEWPFVFKALQNGFDIGVVCDQLVKYRISNNSVCHTGRAVNYLFFYDNMKFFRNVLLKEMIKNGFYFKAFGRCLYYISHNMVYKRKNNPIVKMINYVRK